MYSEYMTSLETETKYSFKASYGPVAKKQSDKLSPLPPGELERMLAEIGASKDSS
jgi:hypothetical protein